MQYIDVEGMRISRVAFGCAAIGGYDYGRVDDKDSVRAISAAYDAGVTLFDTADIYGFGHSERILAEGLAGRRNKAVIATKFGVRWDKMGHRTYKDIRPVYLRRALEKSLRNLKLDCIPLYQVHWPDGVTSLDVVLEELDRCRSAGLVRAFGLTNFDPIKHAKEIASYKVASIQLPYSLIDGNSQKMLEYSAREIGVLTLVFNVLAHGYLTGKYARNSVFDGTDLRAKDNSFLKGNQELHWQVVDAVTRIASDMQISPAQVAISWALRRPFVGSVVVGAKTEEQARQNADASEIVLQDEPCGILDSIVDSIRGNIEEFRK